MLFDQNTRQFISAHDDDDVRRLALQADKWPMVDMTLALRQISGRQAARRKLPLWADTDGLIYPPQLAMEQCSSQATASYKARLVAQGASLVDLTGGLGVDFAFMARNAGVATYVERDEQLCRLARHNLPLLGLPDATVVHGDAVEHLGRMDVVDTIYIDPHRRDRAGKRVYALSDCTPDVRQLAPMLLAKARQVIVKLSPMLDLQAVLRELPHTEQVHIVSVNGECKELLVVMRPGHCGPVSVHCVNDKQRLTCTLGQPQQPAPVWDEGMPRQGLYLYEPNASIMKAGCHDLLACTYGLHVVSRDSHLMIAQHRVPDFPGRCFRVQAVTSLNKRQIKTVLQGMTHAHVAVRNFPLRAPELAQRLHLKEGGHLHIFGTTTASGKHVIVLAAPITPTQTAKLHPSEE